MAPLHPLDELEGPTSDHGPGLALLAVLEAVLLSGGRGIEHEAGAVRGQHVQEECVRMLEPYLHGGGVERLDAVHRLVEGAHARLGGRIHQPVDAELDGCRVHLRSVVEEHVAPELEGVEQAVGRDLPRLRRVAHELPVGRDVQEPTPDVHRDPHHFVAGRGVEIEVGDLVAIGHPERAPALGRLCVGERSERGDDDGERSQCDEETGAEASWAHDVFSLAERAWPERTDGRDWNDPRGVGGTLHQLPLVNNRTVGQSAQTSCGLRSGRGPLRSGGESGMSRWAWRNIMSGQGPTTRRFTEQRWLLDNTIRAVGMDWDQPRSIYLSAPCGVEAGADFAGLRQRITKLADASPAFEAVARRRESKALAAEQEQSLVTARENYFMAAVHWAAAQWPIDENNDLNRFYNGRKRECYTKYAQLADHRVEAAWIPLPGGASLPAWFHLPPGYTGGRIPAVVSIPGMDSFKEIGVAMYGDRWLSRGLAVLAIDGPGQYESPVLDIYFSMEAW